MILEEDSWDDGDIGDDCPRCGGEGHIEYMECAEEWGEDCPSEENHLVVCPECGGMGFFKRGKD